PTFSLFHRTSKHDADNAPLCCRKDNGLEMLYYARHFNGKEIIPPIDMEAMQKHVDNIVYGLLTMKMNQNRLPSSRVRALLC
ncbi:hypothetical protein EJB05_46110, partial [Eragrostis curvula]